MNAPAMAIFAVALVVRLAVVVAVHDWAAPERWEYGIIADHLLAGKGFAGSAWFVPEGPTAFMAPGYVFLLYGFRLVFGTAGYAALQCLQALAGAATVPLLYSLTRRGLGVGAGRLAALLLAVYPVHVYLSAVMHPVVLTVWALLLVLVLMVRFCESPTAGRAVTWGVAIGCAALLDPMILCLAPVWGLAPLVACRNHLRTVVLHGSLAALCMVLVIAPWTIRNYVALGQFVPIKSPLGYLFWVGNHPGATGSLLYIDEDGNTAHVNGKITPTQRDALRALGEPAAYEFLGHEAGTYVREAPAAFVMRTLRKAVYYWFFPYWLTDPRDREQPWLAYLRRPEEVLWMAVGLAAVAGAVLERKRLSLWQVWLVVGGSMMCFTLLYAVTNLGAGPRYRLPLEVLSMTFAGAALVRLLPTRARNLLAFGIALLSLPSVAQETPATGEAPLRWARDRIVVEITLDGHGPYPFLLDSATPLPVVDEAIAEEAGMRVYSDAHVEMPASDGAIQTAYYGRYNSAYAGDIRLTPDEAVVTDLSAYEDTLGEPLAGIVNVSHFGGPVLIDMDRQLLSRVPPLDSGAIVLSAEQDGFFSCKVVLNSESPVTTLLDLGYGGVFALPEEMAHAQNLVEPTATVLRIKDGGIGSTSQVRLVSVLLGHLSLAGPVCDLWPTGDRARIGCGVLRSHGLIIDSASKRMDLVPFPDSASRLVSPVITGIGLLPGIRDGRYWNVRVIAGSPADQSGLQTGDRLVAVDGLPMDEATYPAVAQALATARGQVRRIDVVRGATTRSVDLTGIPLL